MSTNNLESLLSEYEQKRRKAEMNLDERIEDLYKKFPELEEIDDNINQISIDKTKAILNKKNGIEEMDKEISKLKKQKEDFLNKNNIKQEYFEPNYECKICKDTGYVQDINNKTVMCNCLKQKLLNMSYNKSNLSDIKKENFENFNINLFSDEINTQKYKIKCSPRQNMINIKNACMKFIENFDNLDEKSLLFVKCYCK